MFCSVLSFLWAHIRATEVLVPSNQVSANGLMLNEVYDAFVLLMEVVNFV